METSDQAQPCHATQSINGDIARSSLESAESHVAGSPGTGEPGDGSGEAFPIAFKALLEWGEAQGLIRPQGEFPFLRRSPEGHGDEHEAWFDEPSNRWFKATYPNRFGLAWGRDGSATAREYLTRLVLQNTYFSDDIQLIALVECDAHLRILTSQEHVSGEAAPYDAIQDWFCGLGFCRIETDGRIAWYRQLENLLVADAHEGNVLLDQDGGLVPIDLNIIQPCGQMREWALSAAGVNG